MALLPIHRYSLFDDPFPFHRFFPDPWDFYDPWFDFHLAPLPLSTFPRFPLVPRSPRVAYRSKTRTTTTKSVDFTSPAKNAEKFRVQVDVTGFQPENIRTQVEGRQIVVEARHEDRENEGNYTRREIRRIYDLPEQADATQLTSQVGANNTLMIEVPLRSGADDRRLVPANNNQLSLNQYGQNREALSDTTGFLSGSEFQPRIVDKGNNQKQLEMTLTVKGYKPDEIKVSVKNNVLIIEGERAHREDNRSERSFFSKTTTLPSETQVDQLQSSLNDDGVLKIEAPFIG